MAVYRLVHTTFWTDAKVSEDFTPNERFFMLFLMTNDLSSQIGVYEIGKRRMAFMTGLTPEEIDHCINRLREYGVIDYDEKTHEVFIKNWSRYNWIKSPKVRECIFKELRGIKSEKFYNESKKSFEEFYGVSVGEEVADGDAVPVDSDEEFGEEDIIRTNAILCNTEDLSENDDMETPPENDSDTVSIPYGYPMNTVSIPYGEKEKEKEKENSAASKIYLSQTRENESDNEKEPPKPPNSVYNFVKQQFFKNNLTFDDDFFSRAAQFLSHNKATRADAEGYINSLCEIAIKKTSPAGYIYSVFCKPEAFARYQMRMQGEQSQSALKSFTCPCCGKVYSGDNLRCPDCDLSPRSSPADIETAEMRKHLSESEFVLWQQKRRDEIQRTMREIRKSLFAAAEEAEGENELAGSC